MNVARLLYPVEVLGPGRRIGIWFCGCEHRCPGCSNPELWEPSVKYEISLEQLTLLIEQVVSQADVDGFTITGGDPFFQPHALSRLLENLARYTGDLLVYTGYTLEELRARNDPDTGEALTRIGVLIDGRYEEARNSGCFLRGSDNQRIHLLKAELVELYEPYLASGSNRIQNFTIGNSVISVGIHRPGFAGEMAQQAALKGLEGTP